MKSGHSRHVLSHAAGNTELGYDLAVRIVQMRREGTWERRLSVSYCTVLAACVQARPRYRTAFPCSSIAALC